LKIPNTSGTAVQKNNLRGILWMLVYAAIISGMHVCVRLVSEGMPPFEIAFFRNIFGLVVVIPWFIKYGAEPLKTKRFGLLTARGALNTLCMLGFFTAISITPLADVTALSFTAPIYATLIAMFWFREKIGFRRWIAIMVGFAGIIVVLRPGFQTISMGHMLVLGSSLGWAVCLIIIKDLGRTESAVTITTYMSLVMAPLSLIPALYVWITPTPEQLLWLLLLGALGGTGQLAMSQSLRLADTHVVTPFDFTRLIFVSVLAYFLFDQVPDIFVWIGGTMIFSAIAFITYREHQLRS
jgi:drug/metabolite transporter (DMT)-like permease